MNELYIELQPMIIDALYLAGAALLFVIFTSSLDREKRNFLFVVLGATITITSVTFLFAELTT